MKRKAIAIMLVFLMASAVLSHAAGTLRHAWAADAVWTPINSASDLYHVRDDLAGHYKLMQDIDLAVYSAGAGWEPIGTNASGFTGSFDGNGFAIRNLTINRPGMNSVGLFGFADHATIANVHLTNVNVMGHSDVGGLAGFWDSSSISRASVQGTVSGVEVVGGLVGYNSLSNISDSYMAGHVAVVPGTGDSFGGLIGYGTGNGARGSIARSYSTAAVDPGTNAGGLVGRIDGPVVVTSAYWDTETSGQSASAAGTGKSTAQMLQRSTYSGWDFTGNGTNDPVWGMVEGAAYPLQYSDYKKVALDSLNVTDTGGVAQELDRDFAGDYGIYEVRVGSETDQVEVSGSPLAAGSIVSIDGKTDSETLALNPGTNIFEIKVSDADDPAALNVVYKLTVNREDGSAQYPHRIATAEQLSKIGDTSVGYELDDSYELEADIDLTVFSASAGWKPIGSGISPFTGLFEGNGHTIANVNVHRPASDEQGLFGVTSGAKISDVSIVNADIAGADKVGGLIGRAGNTVVDGVSVQGEISGASDVGGLIGTADALTSLNESYAAAAVQAVSGGGGLIGSGAAAGSVTHAFWDSERSGQASSAGGGTPHSTGDMMKQATYTGYSGSVWAFGIGKRWGIVEGTTYPMPYASLQGVSPAAIAVAAPGTMLTMTPSVFNASTGIYAIALEAPVPQAEFTVTPSVGQTVYIDGVNGNTREVDLNLGDKPVEIVVKGGNGQIGVYRFTLAVPSPSAAVISVPPDDIYGIGDELNFVVAYDYPVDVDSAAPPKLPIELDNSAGLSATYEGMSGGDPRKLQFRYTVQEGDRAAAGIQLGDALVAPSTSSVTTIGSPVSLDLASPLPDTNGIVIDGELPEIALTPATTAPVGGPVTIAVDTDGTGTNIAAVKWAAGNRNVSYFDGAGTTLTGGTFEAADNGTYTVYAIDEAGNERVEEIAIANIVNKAPTIALDYTPKSAAADGVDITVSAAVADDAAGNKIEALKWAAGSLATADFDDPDVGTDVPSSGLFHVSANGNYTVFAADSAGNRQVQSLVIDNIIDSPVTNVPYSNPVVNQASYYLVPGREYTLSIEGLELYVPADAIKQATNVTLKKVTEEAKSLLQPGQLILSDVYELLKDTPGKFDVPVRLRLNVKSHSWADDQHPALVYYDETQAKWTAIGGKHSGGTLAGETDHFTKFAVILVDDEPTSEPPIPVPTDIAGHWAEQEIESAVAKGIIAGYPDGTFRPNLPVTRAEFAVLLNRVLALPGGHSSSFEDQGDIPAWASEAVAAVEEAGIVSGYQDRSFRPGAPLSRIETAALIARAARLPLTNKERTSFADDAAIAEWALPYINAALKAGLVEGQSLNRFNPLAPITRAEAVVLLARLASLR